MTTLRLEPFVDGYTFLEAPRWHDGRLWVSDFFSGRVLTLGQDGTATDVVTVDGMPGGLGFLPDGTPLVISQVQRKVYRILNGTLELHADIGHIATGMANDMVVTEDGTAFVGNHGFDMSTGEEPRPAALACITADGQVSVAADDLIFPNGAVVTPDGATLLIAESFAHRITAFNLSSDGGLSGRRVWAQMDESLTPDGICLDEEGCVWAGNPLAGRFIRVREGGEITDEIPTDGRWAVACVFGGDDRRTLYCLHAETSMEDQPKGISQAAIGTIRLGVGGAGTP